MSESDILQATKGSGLWRAAKMNGAGNEIVVLDLRGGGDISSEQARAIYRTPGFAFDQLMALFDPVHADTAAFMRIYNNDGSQSGACGNGTRCVAYYLTRDDDRRDLRLETQAGILDCRREGEFVFRVDMGEPRFGWRDIPLAYEVADTAKVDLTTAAIAADLGPASLVSMGNPHAVFFVSDPAGHDLAEIGPILEYHPIFPERANISLAHVAAADHIVLRVWERGAGLTKACGSAACASVAAAARAGLSARRARVSLPGGDLTIHWREADNRVEMTGPVELEHETRLDLG